VHFRNVATIVAAPGYGNPAGGVEELSCPLVGWALEAFACFER
jgi:hypothetical protein